MLKSEIIVKELEDLLLRNKQRKIYIENEISRKNDYEDGFANGLLEELDNTIDDLEEILKLKNK